MVLPLLWLEVFEIGYDSLEVRQKALSKSGLGFRRPCNIDVDKLFKSSIICTARFGASYHIGNLRAETQHYQPCPLPGQFAGIHLAFGKARGIIELPQLTT